MNLIGTKVKHATKGSGEIIEQLGKYITVQFAEISMKFLYPDVFEKFLKAEDAGIQALIVRDIEENKVAATLQRQAEVAARKAMVEQRHEATRGISPKNKKAKSIDEMFSEDIT